VLLFAGLRVEEVSELTTESQPGLEIGYLLQRYEFRRVPIPAATSDKLTDWIAQRGSFNNKQSDHSRLFVTERSDYMQPRAIQYLLEILLLKRWAGHKSFLTSMLNYSDF
jgi:site-specific recombinase XerD